MGKVTKWMVALIGIYVMLFLVTDTYNDAIEVTLPTAFMYLVFFFSLIGSAVMYVVFLVFLIKTVATSLGTKGE